jgi:hypothetical protein
MSLTEQTVEYVVTIPEVPTVTVDLQLSIPEVTVLVDVDNLARTEGIHTFYGRILRPVTFVKAVLGRKTTFGQTTFTITNNRSTAGYVGSGIKYGQIGRAFTFTKAVSGTKKTFGQIAFAIANNRYTAGNIIGDDNSLTYGYGGYGDDAYNDGPPPPVTYQGATTLPITFSSAILGVQVPKSTPVAEISLASHATPSNRTQHSIKIRARTTTGSGGVIHAALYEGSTDRSGTLTTVPLSNTLTDYTLTISDAAAAAITSYANLSIKVWGYNGSGPGLVFEVSRLYLELPSS